MCATTFLAVEAKILASLDRQLLKIADRLDETFDPDDKESVKTLKLFRSMMTTRRMWAKEYKLVQVPEPTEAEATQEIPADVKTGDEKLQNNSEPAASFVMNDVISPFPMHKKGNSSRKNKRRRR